MVEVRNISKSYGSTQAVRDLSFKAQEGRVFGLIGPNGAGKSTTIRMIMNILTPDAGEILFDGERMGEDHKNRVGYLPEERGLYRKVKLGEMLSYLLELKGVNRREADKKIDPWLERFSLLDWKDKKIEELSKGMSQKAQFIASVAHEPDLFFFDEPFSGLDPVSVDQLREAIMDLGRRGKTILFSTHIMEQAERICDSILLVNKGQEVVSGPLEQIKGEYGSRNVAIEFSGDGSFMRDLPCVEAINEFPRYVDITIKDGHTADELLSAIVGKVSVQRFNVSTPSLHTIFVKLVGGDPTATEADSDVPGGGMPEAASAGAIAGATPGGTSSRKTGETEVRA